VCLDCKVLARESVAHQHKLEVADFRFQIRVQRNKHAKVARIKRWKLKGGGSSSVQGEGHYRGPLGGRG
jgi:hypothetical protein